MRTLLTRMVTGLPVFVLMGSLTACGGGGDDPSVGQEQAEADAEPTVANITSVEPIKKTYENPREVCEDVTVTVQAEAKDKHRIAGSAGGAVIGGVIGHQVGDGRGKRVATAAGAAAGGYVGNKTQERHQSGQTETTTEQQCETVIDKETKTVGYTVKYEIGGKAGSVRMDEPPAGDTIPVVNGQLVLQTAKVTP